MNTPIIDPMIFYYIDLIANLQCLPSFLVLFGLIALLVLGTIVMFQSSYDECFVTKQTSIKAICIYFSITFIVSILSFFIPSKETMLNMLIADQLTPANIQLMGDNLKDAVTFIAEQAIKVGEALK